MNNTRRCKRLLRDRSSGNDRSCGNFARWTIQAGTRGTDRQDSCTRCLRYVAEALQSAQGRNATLTVKAI